MDQNQEIIKELKDINQKLEKLNISSRKFIFSHFFAGIIRSLGTLFGTIIIASLLIYLFSRFNLTRSISVWVENVINKIEWEKFIVPQIKTIELR